MCSNSWLHSPDAVSPTHSPTLHVRPDCLLKLTGSEHLTPHQHTSAPNPHRLTSFTPPLHCTAQAEPVRQDPAVRPGRPQAPQRHPLRGRQQPAAACARRQSITCRPHPRARAGVCREHCERAGRVQAAGAVLGRPQHCGVCHHTPGERCVE